MSMEACTAISLINRKPMINDFVESMKTIMACRGCGTEKMIDAVMCCEIKEEDKAKSSDRFACAHTICTDCFDTRIHMQAPGDVDHCRFCMEDKEKAPSTRSFPIGDPKKRRSKNVAYADLATHAKILMDKEEEIQQEELRLEKAPVEAMRKAAAQAVREKRLAEEEERKRAEEEEKAREVARKAFEEEKAKVEADRKRAEEEKAEVEAERVRAEEEKAKVEADRKKAKQEQAKLEADRKRAKKEADEWTRRMVEEKKKMEEGKKEIDEREAELKRKAEEITSATTATPATTAEEVTSVTASPARPTRKRAPVDPEVLAERKRKREEKAADKKQKLEDYDAVFRENAKLKWQLKQFEAMLRVEMTEEESDEFMKNLHEEFDKYTATPCSVHEEDDGDE